MEYKYLKDVFHPLVATTEFIKFENSLKKFTKSAHVIIVLNGTIALKFVLRRLGLKKIMKF